MSPLAHNTIADSPALELTTTRPAGAIALAPGAPETPAPSAQATDATLILSAFSPGTRRQLELTVNALSRSFRKAIRHAERLERDDAPLEEQDAAWERVNHRSALLQDFIKSLALPAAVPVPTPEPASVPAPMPVPTARPMVPAPAAVPPCLATPSITSGEDALFTECLAEFRRVRTMPVNCRAERRRHDRAAHALITKINRQGDDFANRVHQAMQEIAASDP